MQQQQQVEYTIIPSLDLGHPSTPRILGLHTAIKPPIRCKNSRSSHLSYPRQEVSNRGRQKISNTTLVRETKSRIVHDWGRDYTYSFHLAGVVRLDPLESKSVWIKPPKLQNIDLLRTKISSHDTILLSRVWVYPSQEAAIGLESQLLECRKSRYRFCSELLQQMLQSRYVFYRCILVKLKLTTGSNHLHVCFNA